MGPWLGPWLGSGLGSGKPRTLFSAATSGGTPKQGTHTHAHMHTRVEHSRIVMGWMMTTGQRKVRLTLDLGWHCPWRVWQMARGRRQKQGRPLAPPVPS